MSQFFWPGLVSLFLAQVGLKKELDRPAMMLVACVGFALAYVGCLGILIEGV